MTPPDRRQPKRQRPVTANDRDPKRSEETSDIDRANLHPHWSFRYIDKDYEGQWDWNLSPAEMSTFLQFLSEMQGNTWTEIRAQFYNNKNHSRQKHHDMPAEHLVAAAQRRLSTLELDLETLFRFRLSGTVRLWGFFLVGRPEFFILWWDRDHKVYPVD